jgi:transposase
MDTPESAKVCAYGVNVEKDGKLKRRKFSAEYQAEAVRRIQRSGKSIGKIAPELSIGETALRRWVEQAEVEAGRGPDGALKRSEREELVELRRENQRLRLEREILKNAGLRWTRCRWRSPTASRRRACCITRTVAAVTPVRVPAAAGGARRAEQDEP